MNGERFDLLARIAGGRGTRRGALAALLALAAGSGADLAPDASAKKRKKKCKPACPPGQTCRKGTCACPAGLRVCGAACCFEDQACEMGVCVPCTLLAGSDPAADGQALKALVADPDGPSTIWLGEGVYEVAGGGFPPLAPLEIWRDVTIASCNPERPATVSCPVMQNQATCVVARPNMVIPLTVRLQGLNLVGPGYAALEALGLGARGATAREGASLELDGCTVSGFSVGVWADAADVLLTGGNLVTDNGVGLQRTAGTNHLWCSGEGNRVRVNDAPEGDCQCVVDPAACGCDRIGPCA